MPHSRQNPRTVCFLDRWLLTKCNITFDTSFYLLFQVVPSVLLSMAALITMYMKESDWLLKNFYQSEKVYRATMESKTEGTTWKSIKNYIRNWCQNWCCILFGDIYRENKQCAPRPLGGNLICVSFEALKKCSNRLFVKQQQRELIIAAALLGLQNKKRASWA